MEVPKFHRENSRIRKTTTLKNALEGFLNSSGIGSLIKYPNVTKAWNEISGTEISKHTMIYSFKRGVLEIGVNSSALLNEVEFAKKEYLRAIQEKIKRPFVRKLMFVLKNF